MSVDFCPKCNELRETCKCCGENVILVGERLNEESVGDEDMWLADPLTKMLATPAFPPDSASGKMLERLGLEKLESVNLLYPSPNRKAWDRALARENARVLARDLGPTTRFVLCGRKVQEAFHVHVTPARSIADKSCPLFGTIAHAWGCECLIFPHPSPQSTVWNENWMLEHMRKVAAKFVAKRNE